MVRGAAGDEHHTLESREGAVVQAKVGQDHAAFLKVQSADERVTNGTRLVKISFSMKWA